MTNEEAIRILPDMKGAGSEWDKAIDLAIDALKVQLSKEDATSGCISRQAALELGDNLRDDLPDDEQIAAAVMAHNEGIIEYQTKLSLLPSVQPEIIRCKDCKHWKDSDGVYRRGIGAESKCPMNIWPVYDGVFYCGYAERRTDD